MSSIIYTHNQSDKTAILSHLNAVSGEFSVPLSQRVNIQAYAEKLFSLSRRAEAWSGHSLVGLVAYYHNDSNAEVYITHVAVTNSYARHGIASHLIKMVEDYEQVTGVRYIKLNSYEETISFYKHNGFYIGKEIEDGHYQMVKDMFNTSPSVSICCLTYNHVSYIRQCLDGFVSQKTNFPFEVLVHDDASTDGTADVIKEYEARYPLLIKPIYQDINQYRQRRQVSATYNFARVKGKYIASCEGDDYWTDPYKLQKQVDFLETHPDFSICFHPVMVLNQATGEMHPDTLADVPSETTIYDLATYSNYIHTPSVMYRYSPDVNKKFGQIGNVGVGDYLYHILYAERGKIQKLPDYMAVYRQGVGIWTGPNSNSNDNMFKWIIACAKLSALLDDRIAQRLIEEQIEGMKNELTDELEVYKKQYNQIRSSKAYRLGKFLLKPFSFIRKHISR